MAKRKRKYYETILEMIEAERRGVPIEESFRKLNKKADSKTKPSKLSIAEKEYKDAIRSGASDITVQSKLNALNAIKSGREKKDDGRRWFQKGAFEDGYQIGDISKTIIGTGKDFLDDAATGAIKLGEGIFDMGTYLVGGAADLFGADDFAEDVKKFAARDLTNELDLGAGVVKTLPIGDIFTKANDFINKGDDEKASLLGEKMDSLVQSAGQLAGTAGLQMVGVPWWLTTGASSFGTAAEEAFQNDATYGEAGGYGLIKGGADVLTEKIFGGIKFKGKAFDDAFKQTLTQGISNKTVKTMTKLGWDMAGEGTEEVLAEVIGNVGKKLSYEDEKTWKELLTSEEAMDNYLESFIGGAAMGGGFNVKKAHNSIKTGRDYDTGLSDNERRVVDSEIKNRTDRIQKERTIKQQVDQIIAEREKTFGKLNNSQKENIKDAVISKLESGEIDYTASKLDKKEIAKIETEVIDDLKSGYIGIGTIEDVLAGDKTATLRDLKERLDNTTDNTKKAEIEAEINRITGEKAAQLKGLLKKDVILQESYVQEALKGKEFSREATKEDSDITKELIESAKAAKMNDTRAMHTLFDYTSKIANETNTKYGFTNNEQLTELGYSAKGKTINGFVRKNEDGTTKVLINVDSDKALNSIIGHETTHLLEGTNEYEALQEMVKEYATTKGEYDSRYKELSELYKGVDANLENEITSDLVGDYLFTDEQFVNSLSIKEPNVFKRIYDYVKHAFKMATAGSKEARQLEQVKQRFEKAYRGIEKSARKAEAAADLTTKGDIDNIKYSQNKDSGITYTKLISKPDMPISMVTTTLKDITDKSRKEIVDAARKKLPKQNNNGQVTIHNKDTGMDIVIGKPSLEHGLGRNYEYTAMVSMHLEDYLRNAIKINEAVADGNRKHDSDILLGYGQTESGEKIPAYFVVSKLTTGQKELVEFGSLYSIKAKKIAEDSAQSSQAFQGPTSAKISISALLDIVNETYSDILPKTVAEHYGNERRKTKLGESVRFSLSAPVEETKELVAVHNMKTSELLKTLDLGGLPMPSIAIIKAQSGHSEYGDVSLLFNKETIDPKFMRANKVYGWDAWTPTYPTIEYKVNEKVEKKIRDLYYNLAEKYGYDEVGPLYNYANNLEDTLNRHNGEAGILEELSDNTGMMQLYLLETGKGKVENIEKEIVTELSEAEIEMNEHFINALGEDVVKSIVTPSGVSPVTHRKEWITAHKAEVEEAYVDFLKNVYKFTDEEVENVLNNTRIFDYAKMVRDANNYIKNGARTVRTEIDRAATTAKIKEMAGEGYSKWLKELFSGVEEKTGIRNNADPFTRSGNRRSWEALHWENNLENVVKVMKEQENGTGFFGGSGIWGVSAKEYGSIDEIRADSDRLKAMDEEACSEIKESLGQRFQEIAVSIMNKSERNEFIAIDDAMESIVDAVRTSKTKSGIMNVLEQYQQLNVTEANVDDIVELVKDIAAMPTEYFEAKPRRAVGLDEIAAVIIPDNVDAALLNKLEEGRYNVVTYKAGDEADRVAKLNAQNDIKFSLSSRNQDIAPIRKYGVNGEDARTKENKQSSKTATFSLRNKNITEDTPIPYVVSDKYIHVNKNNKIALSYLQDEVKKLPRGTYENKATGYKADINSRTIKKIINPTQRFNPWSNRHNYIENLNAAMKLPELFENAVYIDTSGNQKKSNGEKFYYFVAPIYMNDKKQRALITARSGDKYDILYVVKVDIIENKKGDQAAEQMLSTSIGAPFNITIPDLIKDVKIYDYDMQKNIEYTKDDIKFSLSELIKDGEEDSNSDVIYNALSEEDLAAYEQERDEAFRRIPDDYMPDEDSEYYNPPDVTPLDDGYLKLVSKNIRKALNLKNNQITALKKIIQDYSTSENQDPESLYKLIKDEFGEVAERNKLQDISEVKAFIRQTGIRVSDYIKSEIPDYASWKQKQFGKMKIAADGLEVDDVYEGLKDVYPQFFPEDIINPAEQLMQISEIVGMNDTVIEKYLIPEEDIQFAADFIYDSVYDYKQQKRLEYAMQDDIAPVDESRIPHNLFDNGDIAPVKSNFDSNDFSKSVGVQQKYDAKTEKITESERDVETERLERKKKQAIEDLGSLEEYTSRKADELYQEVRTMRKGKQVSEDLGYILDHLFVGIDKESAEYARKKDRIYKNITDTLIRMSKNPNKPEKPRGYIESIIREAIESRYRWDIAAINSWELDPVAKTRRELRRNLINKDPEFMKKALSSAKNRNRLFMNNTDTIRTTELVFGRENGKIINDMIFQKAIDNEADSIAWQNKERKEIAALGIKAKDKFGKVTKESAAVQKYGEGKYLDDNGEYVIYDDEALEKEFENPDDRAKIINAARVIRQKYDEYIDKANEVLTSLKFDPIPKRDDYMRHFQVLNDKFSQFGIPFNPQSMQEHVLPTDINGLTEFWSPQKNYFANLRPREGMRTTLDAITGIDGYISGIANLIYHTEDIQRGRAFEELIRENFGEDKGWKNLKELPEEEQAERIEQIQGSHLSEYAAWLHEWTNNLAGKKNKLDRIVEEYFGRKVFSILDGMGKGTSGTMLGFNLSSALTNLIAPVQAMAKTNKAAVLRGTADTIKNIFIKDSFMEDNRFLTARMGTEMLSKRPWDKIRDTGFIFMKGMDWFASNQIVRSKYYELKSKGLSDEEAHAGAGQFAARIMGDRTKGAMPQLYNSKVFNILAQFQLEVNNQLYSMFYDTYHESRESAKERAGSTAAGMVFTLGQLFIFTHIFGQTFKAITGYNPTFDVIAILGTALGIGDDDDDEKTPMERLQKAADMLVDALPYSSLFSDGGRIPVTNMIPDIMGIITGSEDEYGRKKTMASEGKKILPYLLPTGGNQIKKTIGGLKMFSDDLPVTGSYTDKGDLRFPVKENPANVVQAAIFGQWANKNAREYFDKEVGVMDGNDIEEYRDLNIPISDYWKYREELRSKDSAAEKIEYINSLDLSVIKKNIMVNNRIKRENPFDLENYDDFESYEEFKFATDHPEEYLIARASGGYTKYEKMKFMLGTIKADKDDYGKSISGSRKEKIINFLNSSSTMDYGEKLILFKKQYTADDTYNYEIIDYLNSRDDINYEEMRTILTELGFTVDLQGNISW